MSKKCPRCKLALRKVEYEGVETEMCDGCWGFWLDPGELEQVLAKRDLVFSKEETRTLLDYKASSDRGPTAPAPCPQCGKVMERISTREISRPRAPGAGEGDLKKSATRIDRVHLVIDRCPDHGVWLDTGELKKVQAVAERSEAMHKLLLKKLGLLTKV
ncbi:MAG: zf-TFIIB domain-containing protein [Planctomycetes bacterium]|nr:zf-TFIIB domain-containing protein [Planctomycetota bacterium]